jgi:peptidoglycan/xylan/chitin deacetylase (PgdA/CDA1 family)
MDTPLRIFIGYDSKEPIAYHVLAQSLLRQSSIPLTISPLVQSQLRDCGMYTRERGPTESTEFSLTRFLVPYLCNFYGHAMFIDCDMLCRADIAELVRETIRAASNIGLWVCKHDYDPSTMKKFLGQEQTRYPRKNWSSLMVFDNYECRALTPAYVNTATGLALHRFQWLEEWKLGSIPLAWNWLVGEYAENPAAKMLHYTLGGPWFPEFKHCNHSDEWRTELLQLLPEEYRPRQHLENQPTHG